MFSLNSIAALLTEDEGHYVYTSYGHPNSCDITFVSETNQSNTNTQANCNRGENEAHTSSSSSSPQSPRQAKASHSEDKIESESGSGSGSGSGSEGSSNTTKQQQQQQQHKSSSEESEIKTKTKTKKSDNSKSTHKKMSKLTHEETEEKISVTSKSAAVRGTLHARYQADEFIAEVEQHYLRVALSAIGVWLTLVVLSYAIGYHTDALVQLTVMERKAPMVASLLVGMSLISTTLPFLLAKQSAKKRGMIGGGAGAGGSAGRGGSRGGHGYYYYGGSGNKLSGVLVCAVVVQTLALSTDLLLAFFPTPVLIDPVSGGKCYMLRWSEWTPLAFVMAFLTESCSVDENSHVSVPSSMNNKVGSGEGKFDLILGAVAETVPVRRSHSVGDDLSNLAQSNHYGDDPTNGNGNGNGDGIGTSYKSSSSNHAKARLKRTVRRKMNAAYFLAWSQGLSTFCGWAFPLCPGVISWTILLIISCLLFAVLYIRLHVRTVAFRNTQKGTRAIDQESYLWTALSLGLLKTCTYVWSILVAVFFMCNLGPIFFPNNQFLKIKGLSMMLECTLDVLFKAVYLRIVIDVHDTVFDSSTRAERRLEELRQMLNVVWDNSSDVIGISVRGVSGNVTTMLSPTYRKFYSLPSSKSNANANSDDSDSGNDEDSSSCSGSDNDYGKVSAMALAFEIDAKHFMRDGKAKGNGNGNKNETIVPSNMYELSFMDLATPGKKRLVSTSQSKLSAMEMNGMAKLIVRSWEGKGKKTLLMHDLMRTQKRGLARVNIRCEASVTRIEENALVVVVRDISERIMRFEAEKKVISETTARRKDAAANRFTRHEVKNGLLAAIGLCDSLLETVQHQNVDNGSIVGESSQCGVEQPMKNSLKLSASDMATGLSKHNLDNRTRQNATFEVLQPSALGTALARNVSITNTQTETSVTDMHRYLFELDKTLHEVLDTILAEAMARDVIHEVYEPKLERVDVSKVLRSTMNSTANSMSAKRFPVHTSPSILPEFALDPQLLKYIHRNAISNACKYGQKGGVVTTEVHWDEGKGFLRMDVVNLPGEKHQEIMNLGPLAAEVVFSPRRRLTMHTTVDDNNHVAASHSSGDGAWIMDKCAKTLGGNCTIKFESERTVFSFMCPVKPFNDKLLDSTAYERFELPKNLYAIAIDDSKIQRKLLSRFFMFAGIPADRIHIMGATGTEITGFVDWAVDFVDSHPYDLFLFLVDENLDLHDEQVGTKQTTVSGSAAVAEMRSRLLPDQERNILTLIRSANDSANDVAIYNSRAHGYLPKAPIKADSVLEVLAPLWLARFPRFEIMIDEEKKNPARKVTLDDAEVVITMNDLMGCIDDIDLLSQLDEKELREKWSIVWEKMHALKGDLLIMPGGGLDEAIGMITSLRGPKPPANFSQAWQSIRSSIFSGC